ncbi:MAG: GDP-mannose 4,6-dehydratase [Chloroflexota bacterium]
MRIFVTGATGFAGSHLVDQLLDGDHQISALVHPATGHQTLPDHPNIMPVVGDLLNLQDMISIVSDSRPDVIYHLAGQAYPSRSWSDPAQTLAVNTGGTGNLLLAATEFGRPRVVIVSSAEIYGPLTSDDLPLTEQTPARPRHPYGISKQAAGELARVYWERYGLPVIEARPFNHIGPRQAPGFVVPDFASQLAAIRLGRQESVIQVGNLDPERDFTDVRDVAAAYIALAAKGQPGEPYLICSGRPVSVRYLLETLVDLAGIPVEIQIATGRVNPTDTPCLYGSHNKITAHTGWLPRIPLRQSLSDALEDWERRLRETETA